ncbi:MAG TPA: hypothetical protein VFQ70_00760 [Candidatus Saccharimonadaceae bacterium]|nr:hypothetical protein [Candidatus Saccharimonadaceae bacterium]
MAVGGDAMTRLPVPGSDDGQWGTILNDFLSQSQNADGTLKTSAVQSAGSVTSVNGQTPDGSGNVTIGEANIANLSSDLAAKYVKPAGGIPETDLDAATQAKINSVANTSGLYVKAGPPLFTESFNGIVGTVADKTTTNFTNNPGDSADNYTTSSAATFVANGVDGGRAGQIALPAGSGAYAFWAKAIAPQTTVYLRQYIQIPVLAGSSVPLLTIKNGGINGTHLGRIALSSAGAGSNIRLLDGSDTVQATSVTSVAAGQWIRLEWKVSSSGSQTLNIYTGSNLHGTSPSETISAPMGTNTIDYLEWGPTANPISPTPFNVIYDEIVVRNDAYPGPLLTRWMYSGA